MGYEINTRSQDAGRQNLESFRFATYDAIEKSGDQGYIKVESRFIEPGVFKQEVRAGTRSGPLGRFWTQLKSTLHHADAANRQSHRSLVLAGLKAALSGAGYNQQAIDAAVTQHLDNQANPERLSARAALRIMDQIEGLDIKLDEALSHPRFREFLESEHAHENYDFLKSVGQLRPDSPIEFGSRDFEWVRQNFIAPDSRREINLTFLVRDDIMQIRTLDRNAPAYTSQEMDQIRAALGGAIDEIRFLLLSDNLPRFVRWLGDNPV